jgi:hypothetical protein
MQKPRTVAALNIVCDRSGAPVYAVPAEIGKVTVIYLNQRREMVGRRLRFKKRFVIRIEAGARWRCQPLAHDLDAH